MTSERTSSPGFGFANYSSIQIARRFTITLWRFSVCFQCEKHVGKQTNESCIQFKRELKIDEWKKNGIGDDFLSGSYIICFSYKSTIVPSVPFIRASHCIHVLNENMYVLLTVNTKEKYNERHTKIENTLVIPNAIDRRCYLFPHYYYYLICRYHYKFDDHHRRQHCHCLDLFHWWLMNRRRSVYWPHQTHMWMWMWMNEL